MLTIEQLVSPTNIKNKTPFNQKVLVVGTSECNMICDRYTTSNEYGQNSFDYSSAYA